ncbi:MAG: ATP-binding protein [Pseudomonadota bacterium]
MKIRSLLALMITATLLPVVVFFTIPLNRLMEAERDSGVRSMHEAVRATSLAVDGQWHEVIGLVRSLSNSSKLEAGQFDAFRDKARTIVAGRDAYIVLFDSDGQQLVDSSLPNGALLPDTRTAARGRITQVLAGGTVSISNLLLGEVNPQPMIALEFPVTLPEQRRYVLGYGFKVGALAKALPTPQSEDGATFMIFDREGHLLQSNRQPSTVGAMAPQAIADAIRSRSTGPVRMPDGGYAVLTSSPVSGWWVVMTADAARIDGVANRTLLLSGLGLLLALFFAVAAARAFSARIGQAIALTSASAHAIGKGVPRPPTPSGITEVDQLNQSVYNAGRLLAETSMEREQLLAQAQLARAVADAQNRAKDEFLAMLGHELRNPMAPISTAAHLLTVPGLNADQLRQAGAVISRQVEHMNRLVNDLLDVSRVTRGLISLETKPLRIEQVIASAAEQTLGTIHASAHELKLDPIADDIWISGDQTRLVQVMANLLINAAKYSPPQSTIVVQAARDEEMLKLTVSDNGGGIEPDLLPRIFELFSQGARRPDRAAGGLGLGLALVRKIVELHGGSVGAHSEGPGQGSCFTIRLPLCEKPADGG